jgi:hypothetical protein
MNEHAKAEIAAAAERLHRRVEAGEMSAEDATLILRAGYLDGDTPSTSTDTEAGT